jgi:hypothetical protein
VGEGASGAVRSVAHGGGQGGAGGSPGGTAEDTGAGTGAQGRGGSSAGTGRPPHGRLETAQPAPVRDFFIYVWPAIALGSFGGEFLGPLLAGLEGAVVSAAVHALPLASGPGGSVAIAGAGAGGVAGRSGSSTEPDLAPSNSPIPDLSAGGMSLLATTITALLTLVAMVALARLLLGEDLFSPRRWHRGL